VPALCQFSLIWPACRQNQQPYREFAAALFPPCPQIIITTVSAASFWRSSPAALCFTQFRCGHYHRVAADAARESKQCDRGHHNHSHFLVVRAVEAMDYNDHGGTELGKLGLDLSATSVRAGGHPIFSRHQFAAELFLGAGRPNQPVQAAQAMIAATCAPRGIGRPARKPTTRFLYVEHHSPGLFAKPGALGKL